MVKMVIKIRNQGNRGMAGMVIECGPGRSRIYEKRKEKEDKVAAGYIMEHRVARA